MSSTSDANTKHRCCRYMALIETGFYHKGQLMKIDHGVNVGGLIGRQGTTEHESYYCTLCFIVALRTSGICFNNFEET